MLQRLIKKRHKRKSKCNIVYKKGNGKGAIDLEQLNLLEKQTKVCTKCGIEKELNEFHRDKKKKDGRISRCKSCNNLVAWIPIPFKIEIEGKTYEGELKQNRKQTKYLESDGVIIAKVCTKCHNWKSLEEGFSKGSDRSGGRSPICRECNSKQVSKWMSENKERKVETNRIWCENNKEHKAEYDRIRKRNNPEMYKAYAQRRRARQSALPDTLTDVQIIAENEFYGYRCPLTGKTENLSIEHIIPISWGHGGTTLENCYPMNINTNSSKQDANIFEWLQRKTKSFYDRSEYDVFNFWETVIKRKAAQHEMTIVEFIAYVYFCDKNRKSEEEISQYIERGEIIDSRSEFEAVKAEYMPYAEYLNEEYFKTLYNEV